ncbi:MAG: HNH endonuclease, partial [Acidimicrobiia bacterium]|nr:HNH endonuclease [Acidimicrobiia bacterium]
MPRPLKPCLVCGRPTRQSRCHEHAIPERTYREATRRASVVAAHLAAYGPTCPGYGTPRHVVTPPNVLTADHIIPRSKGGEDGPLQVLCRR